MNRKMFFALIAIALLAGIGVAVAASSWVSTITVPAGTPRTSTFTATAAINGTSVPTPNNFALPLSYIGDTYVIVYTLTSTATQPITITQTTDPSVGTWDKVSLPLAVSASGTMTLTVTIDGAPKVLTVTFVASP